ncbi:MAG: TOBE domain-containing protein [Acidimicrobiia bacterium]|nr:TOBE domain-containing protein [Acidimicrobiia bacterium]
MLTAEADGRGHGLIEGVAVPITGTYPVGNVSLLLRPDWVESVADEGLAGTITALWYRGPHTDYRVATAISILDVRLPGTPRFGVGEFSRWRVRRAHALG